MIQPRGKVMGGSSSINGLLYIRGQHEDYDHWRQLGNAGWSFHDVLPYFRRAEDQERGADELHGAGGHLKVSDVCEPHPLCEAFIDGGARIGIPAQRRFQRRDPGGRRLFSIDRAKRPPLVDRGRLSERGEAAAQSRGRRRTRSPPAFCFPAGAPSASNTVEGGAAHTAHANAEVIVSGGAFNSPQLLQLSGLGPAKILRELGIDVVADMPGVGADLQDHLQIRMLYRCTEPITMNDVINNWRHRYAAGLRYLLSRKGLLTIGAGYAGAFLRTRPDLATPDVQFHFLIFSADAAGATLHPFPGFMASVCQLRPDSRGFVRIKSRDPAVPPAIQPRYLSARTDCDCVVDGLKLLRRVMNQPVMRRYIAEEHAPGEQCASDADLLAFARQTGTTVYHPTSTCRMGSDPNAVVDERLRVRGFERLARHRCLDHADGGVGQHQRRRGHDRRERVGYGAGGRARERGGLDFVRYAAARTGSRTGLRSAAAAPSRMPVAARIEGTAKVDRPVSP